MNETNKATQNPLITAFEADIKAFDSEYEEMFTRIKRNRLYTKGYVNISMDAAKSKTIDESKLKMATVNIPFTSTQALLPHYYAKNPEVQAKPKERVDGDGLEYSYTKPLGQTIAIVVGEMFKEGRLKRSAKQWVRASQQSGFGVIKSTWQDDYRKDPIQLNRQNDSQDNLLRLERDIETFSSGENQTDEDKEALKLSIRAQMKALLDSGEVQHVSGMVYDTIEPENMRWDWTIGSLENYLQAGWIAHYTDMKVDDYKAKFSQTDDQTNGLDSFVINVTGENSLEDSGGEQGENIKAVRVWELWHKDESMVHTWGQGAKEFAIESYTPKNVGERWYPFFFLGLLWQDGEVLPTCETEQLIPLADNWEEMEQRERNFRRMNKPGLLGAGNILDEKSIDRVVNIADREIVLVDASAGAINDMFFPFPSVTFNPQLFDKSNIRSNIEQVTGSGDAARGAVHKAKTLGEAEILQSHLSARVSEKQDIVEDGINEIAKWTAEICWLMLSEEDARKIAGDNAVWPVLGNRDDVFNQMEVEIRSGSTVKPDEERDKQNWAQLLPQIIELLDRALAFSQMTGTPPQETPHLKLLKETIGRLDERIDLESFFPAPQAQPQQEIGLPGGVIVGPDGQPLAQQQAPQQAQIPPQPAPQLLQ